MKTFHFIFLGLFVSFSLPFAPAQENRSNSSVSEILRNSDLQDILKSAKNEPEKAIEKATENPDEILRNVTAIVADQQGKNDPDAVPATRSAKSQTDAALENLRRQFSSSGNSGEDSSSIPEMDRLKDVDLSSDKIDSVRKAAREAIPELGSMLSDSTPEADPPGTADLPAPPAPPTPAAPAPAPVTRERPISPSIAQPTNSKAAGAPLVVANGSPPALPSRSAGPMAPQIPDSPELFSGSVPAPEPLKPRYPKPEKFNPGKEFSKPSGPDPEDDTMVITANRSEMDNNKKTLNFSGNVVVEMKDMEMTCDNLLVKLDSKQQMEEIIATGGTVQIKRIGEEGKLQVAKARRASHVAATQVTTLSGGPPYLQDGDRYVNTDSEDARIVLSGDGTYRVDSPKGPGRSVIVVPISGAKKLTGDLGFENKLQQR